ncbi:NAD-dependent epimerase/dehydratase family protein [Patulibacter sp.]|uniref:NAD-dependent epimerase/dehydratase family protein n=1 Tax=Patulibacter sp. TaxID=1912859 RepID=UPI00271721E6|nr:NAD-dependent epimerase/dehydratase family protein [Patulibacter sp.]MDO9409053.1 NAD-dependent epimerase/dehydratase family protein [Patulibacter sp.]
MRLLVLGGSGFVGRAVADEGLAGGWDVATLNRGTRRHPDPRVRQLDGDRLLDTGLRAALGERWDLVVDTWSGAPGVVLRAARALEPVADRYAYVSSCSVYPYPPSAGVDETAAPVAAVADAEGVDYPTDKRGGELAVQAVFGDRALIARAGLILGPHEDVVRLPWWLLRIDRGGDVLAPGPEDLPLQWVDARDLARWILSAAERGLSGPYNTVSRPGHGTMRELLGGCVAATRSDATLHWTDAATIERAGIEAWSELPIWIPHGHEARGMHLIDSARAAAAGLTCRPLDETVRDTWSWILDEDRRPPLRTDRPAPGVDPEKERKALSLT